ncbi:uncharacterized protein LOC110433741 [Sorghum bicolor]|uniref:uncharacterized protein LOC110433741 n=1 Tax=Sorghum bicolor TaxID=4558 RepID=UPI000B42628C|nr:uncharacterized protein LOC110433741 [Sorghum bicolor]|eukprot:XP_021311968.1 uncharacterized protein LOC110433741 [Sorghum bicolor]
MGGRTGACRPLGRITRERVFKAQPKTPTNLAPALPAATSRPRAERRTHSPSASRPVPPSGRPHPREQGSRLRRLAPSAAFRRPAAPPAGGRSASPTASSPAPARPRLAASTLGRRSEATASRPGTHGPRPAGELPRLPAPGRRRAFCSSAAPLSCCLLRY